MHKHINNVSKEMKTLRKHKEEKSNIKKLIKILSLMDLAVNWTHQRKNQ